MSKGVWDPVESCGNCDNEYDEHCADCEACPDDDHLADCSEFEDDDSEEEEVTFTRV